MKAILVPVKRFQDAKSRLSDHYTREVRAELARAMCDDVFAAIAQARGAERVFIVSAESHALERARERGWACLVETTQVSESQSVDDAARQCEARGARALLRLPIDIPLVRPGDIEAILNDAADAPCAVLVPSREGTGTNALLRSPPTLFPSHFGEGSFARHRAEAERAGATLRIHENARIALDIDTIEDLRALHASLDPLSATAQWFARHWT